MSSHLIPVEMPAQLRKFAVYKLVPDTDGQHELSTLCKAANEGRSNSASVIGLTNVALGAALEIAREWRHSKNGNEVQAGRTLLKNYEMTYVPDDPRERRHEFKMPGSISKGVPGQLWQLKERPDVVADLKTCSWTMNGASGRVTHETLGWLLEWAEQHVRADHPAGQRAGKKFIESYRPAWEETDRLIAEHLGGETRQSMEQSVPGLEWEWLTELYNGQKIWFGGADKSGPAAAVAATAVLTGIKEVTVLGVDGTALHVGSAWSHAWWAKLDDGDQEPELAVEPEQATPAAGVREWKKSRLSRYVRWDSQPSYFWFGGVAKAGPADPVGTLVSLTWSESVRGNNLLRDVDSGEVVATVHSMSQVWAAPVDRPESTDDQDQDQEEREVEVEPAGKPSPVELGPVPENWVWMAQEAHTATARAWWARRVANWGKEQ